MPRFNLIEEKWIPCIDGKGNCIEENLKNILLKSFRISEIFDSSPLVTASIYRLLVAVLHRALDGPRDAAHWVSIWNKGGSFATEDSNSIEKYLEKFHDRFHLIDDKNPFLQPRMIPDVELTDPRKLAQEMPDETGATLFEHAYYNENTQSISPGEAARLLIAIQSFGLGGLIKVPRSENPQGKGSANKANLVNCAVCIVKGKTLFQTLILNLHHYNRGDGVPFESGQDDMTAWECEDDFSLQEREIRGYADYLTWVCRRVLFQHDTDESGNLRITGAALMKGPSPKGISLHNVETMVPFIMGDKKDDWRALGFNERKALWRDSTALFGRLSESIKRPRTISWLASLAEEGLLEPEIAYKMDIFGMASKQKKAILWRHEKMSLPYDYLVCQELVALLADALNFAEDGWKVLNNTFWYFAKLVICGEGKDPNEQQKEEITRLRDNLRRQEMYWGTLEPFFEKLLINLPKDYKEVDGIRVFEENEMPNEMQNWIDKVGHTGRITFDYVIRGFDSSRQVTKGAAIAELSFHRKMKALRDKLYSREEVSA